LPVIQVYRVPISKKQLIEAHDLGRRLFDEVQRHPADHGLKVATGTIVDATMAISWFPMS
jgi:hypothetical protein